jgi:hypothetical protein
LALASAVVFFSSDSSGVGFTFGDGFGEAFARIVFLGVGFGVDFGVGLGVAVGFGVDVAFGVGNWISLFAAVKTGRSSSISGFNGFGSGGVGETFAGCGAAPLFVSPAALSPAPPLSQTMLCTFELFDW